MCLIIFAHQADNRYPLVLTANRDEFFGRASDQADFWNVPGSTQVILAGKDLVAGGTWLGVTKSGRFAAVTNIRDPSQAEQKTRSRGELTLDFLAGDQSPDEYCDSLSTSFDEFAGYNLIVGDGRALYYVNNLEQKIWRLDAGIYGLSNGLLNSSWPKVNQGRSQLQQLLEAEQGLRDPKQRLTTDNLVAMMNNRAQASEEELPDTGLPVEIERTLSSAFIHNPERQYGTRCSTAIIVESNGATRFAEQNYDNLGNATDRHFYQFSS